MRGMMRLAAMRYCANRVPRRAGRILRAGRMHAGHALSRHDPQAHGGGEEECGKAVSGRSTKHGLQYTRDLSFGATVHGTNG